MTENFKLILEKTALEWACRTCSRQPFECCVNSAGETVPTHACRFEDAAEMTRPTGEDPELVKEAIDAAADELI